MFVIMNCEEVISIACRELTKLKGTGVDVLTIVRPPDTQYAVHLAKVISKLSPLVGNMIEYLIVSELNKVTAWQPYGTWKRQDPGFPDTVFEGSVDPQPGIEIKTWFPLATEITARFRDSVTRFEENNTYVALLAWLPESLIYGKPVLLDVWVDSALSLASSRDLHYHNPPDYLVIEPEETSTRTPNLQQTNTNGYKFQGTQEQLEQAKQIVDSWGEEGKKYSASLEYQQKIRSLFGRFSYRLDTNFAKIDRIQHKSLEKFKSNVLQSKVEELTIEGWAGALPGDTARIEQLISTPMSVLSRGP